MSVGKGEDKIAQDKEEIHGRVAMRKDLPAEEFLHVKLHHGERRAPSQGIECVEDVRCPLLLLHQTYVRNDVGLKQPGRRYGGGCHIGGPHLL